MKLNYELFNSVLHGDLIFFYFKEKREPKEIWWQDRLQRKLYKKRCYSD